MDQAALKRIEPIASKGMRSEVLTQLLDLILKGVVQDGARLVAQKLATQMGVSTTPIREALVQLAEIGVVENIPNCGAVCRKFGPDELREIYVVRRILETEATRMFSVDSYGAVLMPIRDEMQTVHKALPATSGWENEELAKLDGRLHWTIAEGCGNNRLNHEIKRSWFLMGHIRALVREHHKAEFTADTIQHLEIIDALLMNEHDRAAAAMSRHIDRSCEFTVECLFSHQESG
jgi:DNA-binding GntR family transcriptional regulator